MGPNIPSLCRSPVWSSLGNYPVLRSWFCYYIICLGTYLYIPIYLKVLWRQLRFDRKGKMCKICKIRILTIRILWRSFHVQLRWIWRRSNYAPDIRLGRSPRRDCGPRTERSRATSSSDDDSSRDRRPRWFLFFFFFRRNIMTLRDESQYRCKQRSECCSDSCTQLHKYLLRTIDSCNLRFGSRIKHYF